LDEKFASVTDIPITAAQLADAAAELERRRKIQEESELRVRMMGEGRDEPYSTSDTSSRRAFRRTSYNKTVHYLQCIIDILPCMRLRAYDILPCTTLCCPVGFTSHC
jgi:hypothetical protein